MPDEIIGKGVLQVGFDADQVRKAGETDLLGPAQDLARAAAGIFAGIAIGGFTKGGIDELKQAQQVTAQTEQEIKNLGGTAGITNDQIDALSQSMLDQSGVDDELAKSAANTALRLGVQGDAVRRVVQDANDLSQTYGDITSNSELLAKALAKPEQAARLLKPAIGALTDEQTASIASFVQQGRVAEAQGVILDAVEAKVRGAAVAFGDTLAGSEAKATEELKNARAALVEGLAPGLKLGADLAVDLAHGVEALPGPLRAVAGAAVLGGSEILALAQPVAALVSISERLRSAQQATTESTEALVTAQQASTVATAEMDAATLQRVASNEALTFSDEEVVAAQQARRLAEIGSLVVQDELIASDAELVGLEQAAAAAALERAAASDAEALSLAGADAASLGMAGTLGLAVAGVAIAVGVFSALDDALKGNKLATDDYTLAIEKNTGSLQQNVDAVTAQQLASSSAAKAAADAGLGYDVLGRAVREGTDDFGAYKSILVGLHEHDAGFADNNKQIADSLRAAGAGSTEFGRALIAQVESGDLSSQQIRQLVTLVEGLHNGYTTATGKAHDLTAAQIGLGIATNDTTESQRALNDVLAAGQQARTDAISSADDLFNANQQYESSTRSVEQALRSQASATGAVEDAQRRLNEALRPASSTDKGKADLDLESARLRAQDAQAAADDEQRKLDELRAKGGTPAMLAEQERRVEEARINAQRSTFAITDAEQRLNDIREKGSEQDPAVIDARKNLATAQQNLADTTDAVSDAELRQSQARVGVLDAQEKLNGGTLTANEALQHQLDIYGALATSLDPGSPLRKNLDGLINELKGLPAGVTPEDLAAALGQSGQFIPGRASGGPVEPGQLFRGGEEGWELGIIPSDGLYRAPASGMHVLDHRSSVRALQLSQINDTGDRGGIGGGGGLQIHGDVNLHTNDAREMWHELPDTLAVAAALAGVG